MSKFKMIVKQVEEKLFAGGENCGHGSCPSILEREDGKFIIIGKLMNSIEKNDLNSSNLVKVYGDEEAVVIDREMLLAAFKQIL